VSGCAVQVRSFSSSGGTAPVVPRPPLLAAPVAAVLTGGPADPGVADAAARLARADGAPLLLIAVAPAGPSRRRTWEVDPAGAVVARVAPRLAARGEVFDTVPLVLPPRAVTTHAAARLLALADLHRVAAIVTAPDAPHGLDAAGLRHDLQVLARSRAPRVVVPAAADSAP
jgi:hypothetical protein